jgi:predicted NUDIX family NTP pyrophosphohydrolase
MTRARIRSPWRVANSKRSSAPAGGIIELGELVQPSRKRITAFALEGDFDPAALKSNSFELEWPPQSGRMQSFPEVDRAVWFTPDEARRRSCPASVPSSIRLLERLATRALERNC